jgi:putative acetyltransferase
VQITVDDLAGPDVAAFLEAHVRQMREVSPPGTSYALDLAALRHPDVTFWTARDDGELIGCGALKELDPTHAEIKSMRVADARRRQGIAAKVLETLLAESVRRGYRRLSLETGASAFFAPARALYVRSGFVPCDAFADYRPDPESAFFTREL